MNTQLQKTTETTTAVVPFTTSDVLKQVALIQDIMKQVMKDKEHYGVIPGCGNKPALLKAGAEKIAFTFRLSSRIEELTVVDMNSGHREYRIVTGLYNQAGTLMGQGVGSACTMESKWRFRTGPVADTGKAVPKEYWDCRNSDSVKAQELIGGKGYSTHKIDGAWHIVQQGEKVENDNPANEYNTVLKMAKKRSMVDAILTTTACSDIFTQDIDEIAENPAVTEKKESNTSKTIASQQPKPAQAQDKAKPKAEANMLTVMTMFATVKDQTGESKKGVWKRTYSKGDDGEYYQTFDTKIGAAMKAVEGLGVNVLYKIVKGAKGDSREILNIELADDGSQAGPADDPEQGNRSDADDSLPYDS